MKTPRIIVGLLAALALFLTGCSSTTAADRANENLTKAAENFEVQRKIVGINGITNDVLFEVTGYCSLENPSGAQLDVICKVADDEEAIERTSLYLSDNVTFLSTQIGGVKVDFYRPRIIFRPESYIPNYDIATGVPGK